MITVIVVDDQPLIRSAIARLVEQEPGMRLVGTAADGGGAVASVKMHVPDVVVLDIRMPTMDGVEACRQIRADPALAATGVLMLTTFEDDENAVRSVKAGASGFIGKGSEPEAIIAAIRSVAVGDATLSPRATRALIDRFIDGDQREPSLPALQGLTSREREVLGLVAEGLTNSEIGGALMISTATAKTHVNRIMSKLQLHTRAQLVVAAHRQHAQRAG